MNLRTIRIALWAAVAIVAGLATIAYFTLRVPTPGAAGLGGGDYALVEDTGAAFTPASLSGQPTLLFFGFTHCPEVCPTTLFEMAAWFEELGPDARDLRGYFVSVDPERDTPEIIGEYVDAASDKIHGVTGSRPEIDKMIAAWKVYAKKVPTEDGSYTMDHTASVFLINKDGQFEGTVAYREDFDTAVGKVKKLIGGAS